MNVWYKISTPLRGWAGCSMCVLFFGANRRVFMEITIAEALIISYIIYYCHFFCRQCKIKRLELLEIRFYSVIKISSVAVARNCYAANPQQKHTHRDSLKYFHSLQPESNYHDFTIKIFVPHIYIAISV